MSHAANSKLKKTKYTKGVLEVSLFCKWVFMKGVSVITEYKTASVLGVSFSRLSFLHSLSLLTLSVSFLLLRFQSVSLSSLSLCSVPPLSLPLHARSESGAT